MSSPSAFLLTSRAARMSIAAMEASFAAAVTIAARAPIMAAGLSRPSVETVGESQRMVLEKVEAVIEGSMAASHAMVLLWTAAALGGVRRPSDLALGLTDVARAAAQPAHKRVRANARRLTRKKTR
jgi:hypothetical protein